MSIPISQLIEIATNSSLDFYRYPWQLYAIVVIVITLPPFIASSSIHLLCLYPSPQETLSVQSTKACVSSSIPASIPLYHCDFLLVSPANAAVPLATPSDIRIQADFEGTATEGEVYVEVLFLPSDCPLSSTPTLEEVPSNSR